MSSIQLGNGAMRRSTCQLILVGVPFRGDAEDLRAITRLVDAAGRTLEAGNPKKYPRGSGKALRVVRRRMATAFTGGIDAQGAVRWMQAQDWSS